MPTIAEYLSQFTWVDALLGFLTVAIIMFAREQHRLFGKNAMVRRHVEAPPPDVEETKQHILAAGHEILLAAQGALGFLKEYAAASAPKASQSNLVSFFSKAILVADELGRGLSAAVPVRKVAAGIARPLLSMMEQEMKCQGETPCHRKSSSATKTASSTTRRTRATSRSKTSPK